ncbi:MAG TPA: response regulator [Planctomycetota bacterium]|nr:response regulator [Planctomycetota bacterium]
MAKPFPGVTPKVSPEALALDQHAWAPRVVVADDDPRCRAALQRQLTHLGFRVVPAENGYAALQTIRRHGADALLTDLIMPHMDGPELLLRVSLVAPWVRCVAMTGAAPSEPRLISARERGALETLRKPFSLEQLETVLWRALRRPGST